MTDPKPPRWRWQPGRLGTGYRKLKLAQGRTWDAYLIDYPAGSHVPAHLDPVELKRHFRLNVVLFGDVHAFYAHGNSLCRWWRFVLFRPDRVSHGVRRLTSRRVVLSVGWVRT